MKQKTPVVVKYSSYKSNKGLVQLVQIFNKTGKKELLHSIKEKGETNRYNSLMQKARIWCEENNYKVDIVL